MDSEWATHLALRAPMPESNVESCSNEHDETIFPILCAAQIATHVLELSVETRFTASCLLHRYFQAVKQEELLDPDQKKKKKGKNSEKSLDEDKMPFLVNMSKEEELKWVLAACLFLACKSEEEHRRLRDVINCASMISWGRQLNEKETTVSSTTPETTSAEVSASTKIKEISTATPTTISTTEDSTATPSEGAVTIQKEHSPSPNSSTSALQLQKGQAQAFRAVLSNCVIRWDPHPPNLDDVWYWEAKAKIVHTEQEVLRWLAFDVTVCHPHRAVLLILQQPDIFVTPVHENEQDKICHESMLQLVVQVAFRRLNDAVFAVAALQHPVFILATAAIVIALEEVSSDLDPIHQPDSTMIKAPVGWWNKVGISDTQVKAATRCLEYATERIKNKSRPL